MFCPLTKWSHKHTQLLEILHVYCGPNLLFGQITISSSSFWSDH